jgi:hypothetical protein
LVSAANANDSLALVNQEGAKGYRYISDASFLGESTIYSIFVSDGMAPTYSYDLIADPGNQSDSLNQINTEGAKGYRFEGSVLFGLDPTIYNLYRKDGGSSATYTYIEDSASTSINDFLTQANGHGQSGYWFISSVGEGGTVIDLYMKNNESSATYTYDALTPSSNQTDFITQANSEGAKGYRAKGEMIFGSDDRSIYIKAHSQSSTFTYQADATQTTSTAYINASNNWGAQGYAYFGDLGWTVPNYTQASIYFKASNCSGFLCTTLNPLTQN